MNYMGNIWLGLFNLFISRGDSLSEIFTLTVGMPNIDRSQNPNSAELLRCMIFQDYEKYYETGSSVSPWSSSDKS